MGDESGAWESLLALRHRGGSAPVQRSEEPPAVAALLELYLPFAQVPPRRRFAVAHLGQSLDGRIAAASGASRWVTGEADLIHTHRMRALADAIIVGAGTMRHDDPLLTVRRCGGAHPVRVVIDAERRLGAGHRVFRDAAAPTLLLACADRVRPGERLGEAELVGLPRGRRRARAKRHRRGAGRARAAFPLHRGRRHHHLALSRRRRARPAADHRGADPARLRQAEPDAARDRRPR